MRMIARQMQQDVELDSLVLLCANVIEEAMPKNKEDMAIINTNLFLSICAFLIVAVILRLYWSKY